MNKPLDMATGKNLIDSVNRLNALIEAKADGKIVTLDKNAEAEEAGLREHIKNQLFEHCGFMLGCWFAVQTEYEPLCQGFAGLLKRANGINSMKAAQQAVAENNVAKQQEAAAGPVTEGDPLAPQGDESNLVAPPGAPLILQMPGKPKRRS